MSPSVILAETLMLSDLNGLLSKQKLKMLKKSMTECGEIKQGDNYENTAIAMHYSFAVS